MAKITNPNYKKFLNGDVIYHIDYDDLAKILSNIKGEYADMGKALVVLLYYTGARPAEALLLKTGTRVNGARDPIERDGNHIIVNMPSVKRGKERKLRIPLKKPFVDVLYKYSISMPPSSYYFHYYMGNHETQRTTTRTHPETLPSKTSRSSSSALTQAQNEKKRPSPVSF